MRFTHRTGHDLSHLDHLDTFSVIMPLSCRICVVQTQPKNVCYIIQAIITLQHDLQAMQIIKKTMTGLPCKSWIVHNIHVQYFTHRTGHHLLL